MEASAQDIITNFESGKYTLHQVPRLLDIEHSGVHVHKDGLQQDIIKSQEFINWEDNRVLIPKLKGSSYGAFYLDIGLIGTQYFKSREKLDSLYANEWSDADDSDDSGPLFMRERISLKEALELLEVTISSNMDYYLANRAEMEKDLGKKLDSLDLSDESVLKQLEGQLFDNQMTKIFGEEEGDGGAVILTDFHLLYRDGNSAYATAKRGNYYWIFLYNTS